MTKLTPEQEKVLRNLLTMIETAHTLIRTSLHTGDSARTVGPVLQWLEAYHKDIKYQLPVAEAKAEVKAEPVVDVVAEAKASA